MNEKIAAFQGLRKVLKSQTRANFTHVQQNADGFRKSRENCSFFFAICIDAPVSWESPLFLFPRPGIFLSTFPFLQTLDSSTSFILPKNSVVPYFTNQCSCTCFFTNVVWKFSLDFPTVKLGKGVHFSYLGCIKKKKYNNWRARTTRNVS